MTSPISDILRHTMIKSCGNPYCDAKVFSAEEADQALTALLEAELNKAAERYDYTEGVEVAYDVIDSVKKALGIPTEPTT